MINKTNGIDNLHVNEQNITTTRQIIKIKLEYSPRKIKVNPPLPNSILNPETNSDSPSPKSNGVRLDSANKEINQISKTGK